MRQTFLCLVLVAVVGLLVACAGANASPSGAPGTITGPMLHLWVEAGNVSRHFVFADDWQPGPDGRKFDWVLPAPVEEHANGKLLYRLESLKVNIDTDPEVNLSFSVTAGNTPTNFVFSSALVNFAPIPNPAATATAGVTVTDNDGNGATLTGQYAGPKAYEAEYNVNNTYALLVDGVTALPDSTNNGSEATAGSILGNVNSIRSHFSFQLTALDSASGTSRFTVIPEPSSMLALGGGVVGLAGLIRRKTGNA